MTKTFCDFCKDKEIIGRAPATLLFSFQKSKTSNYGMMDVINQNIVLCEECAEKVAQFIIDNGLDKKQELFR